MTLANRECLDPTRIWSEPMLYTHNPRPTLISGSLLALLPNVNLAVSAGSSIPPDKDGVTLRINGDGGITGDLAVVANSTARCGAFPHLDPRGTIPPLHIYLSAGPTDCRIPIGTNSDVGMHGVSAIVAYPPSRGRTSAHLDPCYPVPPSYINLCCISRGAIPPADNRLAAPVDSNSRLDGASSIVAYPPTGGRALSHLDPAGSIPAFNIDFPVPTGIFSPADNRITVGVNRNLRMNRRPYSRSGVMQGDNYAAHLSPR